MLIGKSDVKAFPNYSRHVSEIAGLFIGDDFIEIIVTEINRYCDQIHDRYKSDKTQKYGQMLQY